MGQIHILSEHPVAIDNRKKFGLSRCAHSHHEIMSVLLSDAWFVQKSHMKILDFWPGFGYTPPDPVTSRQPDMIGGLNEQTIHETIGQSCRRFQAFLSLCQKMKSIIFDINDSYDFFGIIKRIS